MFKKLAFLILFSLAVLAFASCDNAKTKNYTYVLSKTAIEYNESFSYGDWYDYALLKNGAILEKRFASTHGGAEHYYNFVYDESGEGYAITYSNDKYYWAGPHYRMVLETDGGDIIVSNNIGETELYGSDWTLKEKLPDFYFGNSVDGGRYFAINDKELVEITYAIGVDGYQQKELYALYRYTEKLTPAKYSRITECEGGFECVYVDKDGNEQIEFYKADDKVPREENDFTAKITNGKYFICDNAGNVIVDKAFDYISEFSDSRAVVVTDQKICVLEMVEE